jgi:drug/metabolite transporter (DMT)-like permease
VVYILLVAAITSGGFTQVLSISRVKATLFSTLLSWRLLVVLGASWVLLGERLESIWQGVGVVIVILSITLYLRHQATYNQSRPITIVRTTNQEEN